MNCPSSWFKSTKCPFSIFCSTRRVSVDRGTHKNSIFLFLVSTGLQPEVGLQSGIFLSEKQIFPLVHGSSVTNCIFLKHCSGADLCSCESDSLDEDELEELDEFLDLFNLLRLFCLCVCSRDSDSRDCLRFDSPEIDGCWSFLDPRVDFLDSFDSDELDEELEELELDEESSFRPKIDLTRLFDSSPDSRQICSSRLICRSICGSTLHESFWSFCWKA